MRLRRRTFEPRIKLQSGEFPIVVGLGFCSFESSIDEARKLALDLAEAIENFQNGGGMC